MIGSNTSPAPSSSSGAGSDFDITQFEMLTPPVRAAAMPSQTQPSIMPASQDSQAALQAFYHKHHIDPPQSQPAREGVGKLSQLDQTSSLIATLMGTSDQTLCALLEQKAGQAAEKLQSGAIVIGEDHGQSSARMVMAELIRRGTVKKLFVELPSTPSKHFIDLEERSDTVSVYLREHAGEPMENNDIWYQVRTALERDMHPSYFEEEHGIKISLPDLIQYAIESGVQIHCNDNSPLARDGNKAHTEQGVVQRNQVSGKDFRKHAQPDEPGVALLAGADHTDQRIGQNTLQHHAGISQDCVFNLGDARYYDNRHG